MVRKPTNCFQREEEEVFHWSQKTEDLSRSEATTVSELDRFAPCSLAKKSCSLDKINGNYSLEETENSGVHARRMRLELGQGKYKFIAQCDVIYHVTVTE